MGRTVQQNTSATFKAVAGASVQKGDLLYYDSSYKVYPAETSTMTFNAYSASQSIAETTVDSTASTSLANGHCILSNGDFVYAYGVSGAVKFARYNSSGVLQGSLTTVESVGTSAVTATALSNGGFLIAYDNAGTNVRFAIYDASGAQTTAPTTIEAVNTSTTGISAVQLSNGNVVVAYGNGTTNSRYAIYNASGVQQVAPTTVAGGSPSQSGSRNNISVATVSDGNFVIAVASTNTLSIYKFNATGGAATDTASVILAANTYYNVKVLNCGENNIVVFYSALNGTLRVIRFTNSLSKIAEPSTSTSASDAGYNPTIYTPNGTSTTSSQIASATYPTIDASYNTTSEKIIIVAMTTLNQVFLSVFDKTAKQENNWIALNSLGISPSVETKGNSIFVSYRTTNDNLVKFAGYSLSQSNNISYAYPPCLQDGFIVANKFNLAQPYLFSQSINDARAINLNNGNILTIGGTLNQSAIGIIISDIYGRVKLTKTIVNQDAAFSSLSYSDACVLSNGNIAIVAWANTNTGTSASAQLLYIYDSNLNPVLTAPITVKTYSTGGAYAVRVAAYNDGNFAVVYSEASTSVSAKEYTNAGVQVGSEYTNLLTGTNFSSTSGNALNAAITKNGMLVIVGQNAGVDGKYTVRSRSIGTAIVASTTLLANTSGNARHEVLATNDGGFVISTYTTPAAGVYFTLYKFNSSAVRVSTVTTNPFLASNTDGGKIAVDKNSNVYINAIIGNGSYVLKYSSNLTLLNVYIITPSNNNQARSQIAYDKNTIYVIGNNSTDVPTYSIAQETPIIGVAAEAGSENQTIDIANDGTIELRENWLPASANYLSASPTGIKGSIYGFTAELTRQRNNLG